MMDDELALFFDWNADAPLVLVGGDQVQAVVAEALSNAAHRQWEAPSDIESAAQRAYDVHHQTEAAGAKVTLWLGELYPHVCNRTPNVFARVPHVYIDAK